MKGFSKNIQLMVEFVKGPFLGLIFSYYILMTFSTMLSVTLLPMLMKLLSTLNLNLTCETLWTGAGSGLLISILKRLSLVRLTSVITLSLLMWKWIYLKKTHSGICWGCLSPLNWIKPLPLSLLLKLLIRNFEPWLFL